jgi:DNA-binding NtrC family response regulator
MAMEPEVPTQLDTEDGASPAPSHGPPRPGLVLVFVGARAQVLVLPVPNGGLELGRTQDAALNDASISRSHARVSRHEGAWTITDLDSRNGTFVDGVRIRGEVTVMDARVLRLGSAVFLLKDDVAPLATGVEVREGVVVGPTLLGILERVGHLARLESSVHINGGSGSGKEIVARAFHAASKRTGAFIAVNCAAIPTNLAERLLFGTRRGAFSGADSDAEGYVQAANKGTLFLDEIGDLEATVQAKLLRVLETKEVLPLGAVTPQAVDMILCSATIRSLLAEVEAKRFREDLYYRVGRPAVVLPSLGERIEEIAFLIQLELERMPSRVQLSASFVEACLLRPWRGNVRELLQQVREAASLVLGVEAPILRSEHLPPLPTSTTIEPSAPVVTGPAVGTPQHREVVEKALGAESGNVSATARRLGVHRNQLRRWMTRYGLAAAVE